MPQKLVLGDPGARDAALHAIQACIPHARVLPVAVEHWLPGKLDALGPWIVEAWERERSADTFLYDLDVFAADGSLRERWQGLRLRKVAPIPTETLPPALLAPYLERRIGELIPGAPLHLALEQADDRTPSDSAIEQAIGHKVVVLRRPDGKPEADGPISAAHAGEFTLAVTGAPGCDLEWVDERPDGGLA